jgi:two-component system OmpR family response regulator
MAWRRSQPIALTAREYAMLEVLMRNSGRIVSRDRLFDAVWGHGCDVGENTIEAFVRLLRLKVDMRQPRLIHTVRGAGYMIREP